MVFESMFLGSGTAEKYLKSRTLNGAF